MKTIRLTLLVGAMMTAGLASYAEAGALKRACVKSDRSAANPALCGCIQRIADQTLTRSEQRMVSKFFRDPNLAQQVRKSDTTRDDQFWVRYMAFGKTARASCG